MLASRPRLLDGSCACRSLRSICSIVLANATPSCWQCNAVADALSRHPAGEPEPEPHSTMFDTSLCAVVRQAERFQACWGQTRPFLTRGGEEAQGLEVQGMHERAQELVNLEVDTGAGQSRQVLPPGDRTIQEAQALRHEATETIIGQCARSRAAKMGASRGAPPSAQRWSTLFGEVRKACRDYAEPPTCSGVPLIQSLARRQTCRSFWT